MNKISFADISKALTTIKPYINKTPLFSSQQLNKLLDNTILFKMENQQVSNSFKARGAFNAVLSYQHQHGYFPKKMVAYSSGNHGYALSLVGKVLNIPTLIFMTKNCNQSKITAVLEQGAELILCDTRQQAMEQCLLKEQQGYVFFHPSDNPNVIAGQGTCIIEDAIDHKPEFNAVFATCGGGGLLSGCVIACNYLDANIKVIGCEPASANDASLSFRQQQIYTFKQSPQTIADGARSLQVSPHCFPYLLQLHDILEINEEQIIFWQQQLTKYLQQNIEYTSAVAMAGCVNFLQQHSCRQQQFLVIISGGNI
jgi:threonine dehydratase